MKKMTQFCIKTSIKCQLKPFIEFKFAGATINLIKPNEPKMSDREREPLANNRNYKNGCYVMMTLMKNDTLILRLNQVGERYTVYVSHFNEKFNKFFRGKVLTDFQVFIYFSR